MAVSDISGSMRQPVAGQEVSFSARSSSGWRFERDGIVFTGNGRVGVLKQVIVDPRLGEVSALVVELDRTGERVLVPPVGVERTRGSAIQLATSRAQFDEWLKTAPRYDASKLVKANIKQLMKASKESIHNARLSISQARADVIETGRS